MSLDTLNNGDSGLEARTKINAAIAAVNAGGNGGGALVRAKGTLTGHTTPGGDATPGHGGAYFNEWSSSGTGTVDVTIQGTSYTFTFDFADPMNGSYFIDITGFSSGDDAANAFYSGAASVLSSVVQNLSLESRTVAFDTIATGSSATVTVSVALSGSGGIYNNGADGYAATGGTQSIDLIPADGTKTIKPVRIWVYSEDQSQATFPGIFVGLRLMVAGTPYELGKIGGTSFGGAELAPFLSTTDVNIAQEWFAGRASAKLTAYLGNDEGYTVPVGGQVTVYAIAEQA